MNAALKSAKSCAKVVAKTLFPQAMYARRIRRLTQTEPEIRLLPALTRKDALSVDVGANEGLFVWHLLPLSQGIVAFEPLPPMQKILKSRYGNRIRLEGVILSDHPGEGELRYPRGNYSWATTAESNTLSLADSASIEKVNAPMKTLDSFALANIGFIKIDVEGHEEAVLRGGADTIAREKPNLLIEIEERHSLGSLKRVHAFLEKLGYAAFFVDGRRILSLDSFDPARDQPIRNVSELGKTGKYINNFLFFPQDRSDTVVKEATACL